MITYKLNSRDRYIEFLKKNQGTILHLGREIMKFKASDGRGIGSGVKPWVIAGLAKKIGPKKYLLEPNDWEAFEENADRVLEVRYKLYGRNENTKSDSFTEQDAIDLLKSKGYKILKPNTQYTEI